MRDAVRLVTWNLHSCIGTDGRQDPQRIASVLREMAADIIALQEVPGWRWEGRPVVEWLAAALDMDFMIGPTLMMSGCPYGNAVLSAGATRDCRRHDLSQPGREPRGLIEAMIEVRGLQLRLLNTHLGLQRIERRRQLQQLSGIAARGGGDVGVVAGDINEWRRRGNGLEHMDRLLGKSSLQRTFPSRLPLLPLDRFWCSRPGLASRARVLRNPVTRVASDHLPLILDIECDPGPDAGSAG